jgi:hypothetical protein
MGLAENRSVSSQMKAKGKHTYDVRCTVDALL